MRDDEAHYRSMMFDTVIASIEWPHTLDQSLFDGGQSTTDLQQKAILRLWRNRPNEPRITYWLGEDVKRLRVEFSIPSMAKISPYLNPQHGDVMLAIYHVNTFLAETFSHDLPSILNWHCSRIDYAWNWDVGADMKAYMSLFQQLWMGTMARHPYPESQGVVFKSKQRGSRWVKFYDKGKQLGERDKTVIRFEISNFKRTLPYMCEHWFGCDRTVGNLLHPGRALYCMAMMWERLGLDNADTYGGDASSLLLRLRKDYGNASLAAYGALHAIRSYGADVYKHYDLMSKNTYYTWKRRLSECGYTTEYSDTSLMALHLPSDTLYQSVKEFQTVQNLAIGDAGGQKRTAKIFAEILAPALGVRPDATPSKYLIKRFNDATAA